MERDQAVDIVAKIATQFVGLSGQAHNTGHGWTVQIEVLRPITLEAATVDEARTLWRFLGRAGLSGPSPTSPLSQPLLPLSAGGDAA